MWVMLFAQEHNRLPRILENKRIVVLLVLFVFNLHRFAMSVFWFFLSYPTIFTLFLTWVLGSRNELSNAAGWSIHYRLWGWDESPYPTCLPLQSSQGDLSYSAQGESHGSEPTLEHQDAVLKRTTQNISKDSKHLTHSKRLVILWSEVLW